MKYTTESFIMEALEIHGDKYDYSLVNYINKTCKIQIICKKHGVFLQRPSNHLSKHGCKICSKIDKRNSQEEVIQQFNLIHGDTYNYDLVNYINSNTKIKIICKKHGLFEQTPSNHKKYGCIMCGGKLRKTTEIFISQSNLKHNNYYDYSNVEYLNWKTKVKIICPKHGEFLQKPEHHLKGNGCPICKLSKGELEIEKYLKENKINYKPQFFFEDLKYKDYLYFDFGLIDNNGKLIKLIEYNGLQHYKFIKYFHKTENKYNISKIRDQMKIDYCEINKIPLFIIKYDEDINEKIKGIL